LFCLADSGAVWSSVLIQRELTNLARSATASGLIVVIRNLRH
jgi:hypothetical protein